MTAKEFINTIAHSESDIIQIILDILSETQSSFCVIGGLAVNAYTEPVVSLDLDIVIVTSCIESVVSMARHRDFRVEQFEHSINLSSGKSALRIQIQTDERYQNFIERAERKIVLDYEMSVARIEDVLRAKIWAYQDGALRKSKRQKDLADIMRIIESFPALKTTLPDAIRLLVE